MSNRIALGLEAGLAAFVDWATKEYTLHVQAFALGGHQAHGGQAWAPLKGKIFRGSNGKPVLMRVGLDNKGGNKATFARATYRDKNGKIRRPGLTTPLVNTGKLRSGLKIQLSGTTAKLFDDVSYAPYHQYGTRKMVVRLIIDVTQADIERLKAELKAKIEGAINRGL